MSLVITDRSSFVTVSSADNVSYWPASSHNPLQIQRENPGLTVGIIEGYGVRGHDLAWSVFDNQVDAEMHYEFLADGREYLSEVA